MAMNEPREYKELTADHLSRLLTELAENSEADAILAKRGCSRWLLRSPAEFRFRDRKGTDIMEYVTMHDISMIGVGLLCKKHVPAGVTAELVLPLEDGYYKVNLRVAHCTQTIGGYKVGSRLLLPDVPAEVPMINHTMLSRQEFQRNGQQ